jgi:hypothetical protein
MTSASTAFLQSLLEVAVCDLRDRAVSSSLRAVLGLVLHGGLRFALGPIAYALPFADLIAWMAEIGYKSYERHREIVSGTWYDVRTTPSGVLIAENKQPVSLQDFSLPLPEYFQIPIDDLFSPTPSPAPPPSFYPTSAATIYHDLGTLDLGFADAFPPIPEEPADPTLATLPNSRDCPQCGCTVVPYQQVEYGHVRNCPEHPSNLSTEAEAQMLDHMRAAAEKMSEKQGEERAIKEIVRLLTKAHTCSWCDEEIYEEDGVEIGHRDWCCNNPANAVRIPPRPSIGYGRSYLWPMSRPIASFECTACGYMVTFIGPDMISFGHSPDCPCAE